MDSGISFPRLVLDRNCRKRLLRRFRLVEAVSVSASRCVAFSVQRICHQPGPRWRAEHQRGLWGTAEPNLGRPARAKGQAGLFSPEALTNTNLSQSI